jgi:hypothetical protein
LTPAICVVCPTMWDEAELPALAARGRWRVRPLGHDASEDPEAFDAEAFIDEAIGVIRRERLQGVMATDDYPGSLVAAAIAHELGLPGPSPRAVFLCQHKYYGRLAQREAVPEAVPDFALVDPADVRAAAAHLAFPAFVKPVKSFFSLFAREVHDERGLEALAHDAHEHLRGFVKPFNDLLARYTDFERDGGHLLAEAPLQGRQATLEGCAFRGEVAIVGIVDSIMYPGTISFRRFEYPSALEASVQARMARIAERLVPAIGFDDGLFNIEMMYDESCDAIRIVEMNPRMCPQFADLMEKVNGVNTYEIALDVAAGRRPRLLRPEAARYRFAASFVPRLFEDRVVARTPGEDDRARFRALFPDARLKVLCREGRRLSEELQDGATFRYAVVNLGAQSRKALLERYDEALESLGFAFEAAASPMPA